MTEETGEELLDIGEVARRSGLAPSALRFYERKGLIEPAARNGLRRAYRPETLDRLGLIGCARDAGFTLAEIGAFLGARPSDTTLRERMAAKEREVDARVRQLTRLRDSLRHASVCDHDPLVECPDFKRAIRNVSVPEDVSAPETAGALEEVSAPEGAGAREDVSPR